MEVIELTQQEIGLIFLLRKAAKIGYADVEITYQDGKAVHASIREKIKL